MSRWLAFVVLAAVPAAAQTEARPAELPRFVLVGVKSEADCAAELKAARAELAAFRQQFPAGWTIHIACTEIAWQRALQQADNPPTDRAFTNLTQRYTVVRGRIFRELRSSYRRTLAHELAHALCACAAERGLSVMTERILRGQPLALPQPEPPILARRE